MGMGDRIQGGFSVKKLYISGPMTGLPDNGYPSFNESARVLRANGHKVYNPAEIPDVPASVPKNRTWIWYMKKALIMMLKADVIVLLPGWNKSKGAKVERWLAKILCYEILYFQDMGVVW